MGGANDAKCIYIKVFGEESVAAAVLAPLCTLLGMSPKKVGDHIHKASTWLEK